MQHDGSATTHLGVNGKADRDDDDRAQDKADADVAATRSRGSVSGRDSNSIARAIAPFTTPSSIVCPLWDLAWDRLGSRGRIRLAPLQGRTSPVSFVSSAASNRSRRKCPIASMDASAVRIVPRPAWKTCGIPFQIASVTGVPAARAASA